MQRRKVHKGEDKKEEGKKEDGLLVIGAGHGRTGTLSMKAALEILGLGPCYHMTENFKRDHSDLWYKLGTLPPGDPARPAWSEIFKDYPTTMDFPAFLFYKELMEVYPKAKIILTLRDSEKWFESVKNSIRHVNPSAYPSLGLKIWFTVIPFARRTARMRYELLDRQFNGDDNSKESWIKSYERHNAEVQRVVPKERLLVYRVGEGWEPLCKFLEVPIPNKPFPHVNDTKSFQRRIMLLNVLGYTVGIILLSIVTFVIYLLYVFLIK